MRWGVGGGKSTAAPLGPVSMLGLSHCSDLRESKLHEAADHGTCAKLKEKGTEERGKVLAVLVT